MQSRYNKSNTSSLPFSSSGPSAINLYTNKTPSMKSNATSGYSSETSNSYSTEYNKANDHYSSPSSALTSLPGYISDFGSSHLSKGSYHQTNTYGSSPGVKNYSYPFSSPATSRNLSTNCSRIPSVTSSYSSGYIRSNSREDVKLQLPPKSPSTPRYISYTRSSRTSNTNYSSNTSSLNNNNSVNDSKTNKTNQNIEETKTKNKAPADFTSDSEDENTDIETKIISHTNTISISRSTSPKRETQTDSTNDSISSTQQIIRQKKRVFGVSIKKTTQETQVNEMDLKEGLSPSLSPSLSPCVTPSPSHSPSPVRMRYGCTPNKRNNNSSNFNRYSMPTIRSTTYSTNYSNFSSNTNISQSNQIENRISPQPLSSCDKQSDIKETSINNMSSDNQNANKDKKVEELCNNYNSAKNDEYDGYSNTNSPKSDSKSLQSIRDSHSSPRISPRIIRRRRSLSRNKLSGRSRSSSKEKLLDREESSTTSTSDSSEDEDDKKKSVADRHSRIKRKKKLQANELIFNDNKVIYKGSFDGINELKPTHLDSMPTRSVSAEPLKSFDENNQKKSSNESSSSPEKVIIRKPSVNIQKIEPLIVVTKLPLKIKDPYSTASECDESEFISESEAEKFSSSTPVVTIILSQSPTQNQSKQSDESSSETTDESTKICDNLNKSETKIQKSPTVIEVNLDNDTNSIQKSSTLTEVIAKSDESKEETDKYESSPDNETDDLSDFDDKSLHSFQEKQAFIAPFPKEDDEIPFKQLNSKDTSLRDSGFSEASTRPDSPYDNIKTPTNSPNIVSYENIYETDNCCAKEIIPAPQQFISKVNDIDSLLSGYKEETFEEFERKFQTESKHPVKYLKDDARKNLSLFISKCQDIDEMIGPTSPISPNLLSNFSSTSLSKLIEEIGEDDDSVAIDASAVKVHNAKAMKSTVILFFLNLFSKR